MCSIIEQLSSQEVWEEYLAYRLQKGRFSWHEFEEADDFVERERYLPAVQRITKGEGPGIPRKKIINKMGTGKKRVVYSYTSEEMSVLKVLAHLLYKYDDRIPSNCHAFRRGSKATDAVLRVHRMVRGKALWGYKLDISNYFNSISVPILLEKLSSFLTDDPMLYEFFCRMYSDDRAEYGGVVIREARGAMAGVPTASFMANIYLVELDRRFQDKAVVYARYSDDIIVFAEDLDALQTCMNEIKEFIKSVGLEINPSKERIFRPDEPYEFLGFKCFGNVIDIADSAMDKMKGKIRRKMRSVLRWKQKYGISEERAISRFIRYFDRKFYDDTDPRSLTWSRWYFPIVNTPDGLRTIDHYMQQCIRVISTGRHNKSNYRLSYERMKSLGFRSLVHEFYSGKQTASTASVLRSS